MRPLTERLTAMKVLLHVTLTFVTGGAWLLVLIVKKLVS